MRDIVSMYWIQREFLRYPDFIPDNVLIFEHYFCFCRNPTERGTNPTDHSTNNILAY